MHVAIAGNIGAGKTTLTHHLANVKLVCYENKYGDYVLKTEDP